MQRLPEAMSSEAISGNCICLRYISGPECLEARGLWQEVFFEDSQRFTDYYFQVKAPENEGFVLEGEEGLRAMLFLTPERMRIFEKEVQSAYIVGVATKVQFRHRGYMAVLLRKSMAMLYGRGMPFVFLMPASAAIYEPFAFRFIYDRPLWDAKSLHMDMLRPLDDTDIGKIAEFSQAFLEKAAAVHICRDVAYDRVLLEEIAAQEGTVLGLFDTDGGQERLTGVCLYTCEEGEADIQEVLADPETEKCFVRRREEKRPCIMARIVHLPAMLSLLRTADSCGEISFLLQVTDDMIAENNGSFLCRADKNGCCVRVIEDPPMEEIPFWSGSIAELVQILFDYGHGETQPAEIWSRLRLLDPVWINEIV